MKILKILILIFIFGFIVWVDLAETLKAKFKFIPTSLDFNVFNYKIKRHFKTHLGLDLKGGSHLVFDADTTKVKPEDLEDALNSVRDIVERRVNLFGISEPSVQTLKSGEIYRVSIDLPGITSVSDAIRLIGQTAQLSFREQASPEAKIATDTPVFLILQKETGLTGKHVKKATVTFDQQNGKPQVALSFSGEGAKIFSKITARNVGRPVGIFVDELLISAPIVQQAITDGNAVITGSFTVDDAKKLAIAINSGALPLPVKLVEQRNIGPTLGKIEVNKSVVAGGVGLLMVLIFMIGYYGKLGLIASAGLVIYGL
ncbi:protein translocase subunit SecD, partial [Candidatus Roizmanbacteria bacterium]|nr:protein translocase subunit SecD [Candidatus Roizmanbacteria bacterium]